MDWVWALAGIVLSGIIGFTAIRQTRKYQNHAELFVTWDRIGLAGGIELVNFASFAIPYMTLIIENHGTATARLVDVTTTSVEVGTTQETYGGVRPYQQKSAVATDEPWEVRIPLYKIRESFDHPITVVESTLIRPKVTVRWKRDHGKGFVRKTVRLDGDWLTNYAQHLEHSKIRKE